MYTYMYTYMYSYIGLTRGAVSPSQAEHDKHCNAATTGAKCRLAQKPKNHAVVAAGLIM